MGDNEKLTENIKDFIKLNYWKVRNCDDYKDEYKNCVSFAGRFHQYFVHGEFADCSKWKEDMTNCEKATTDFTANASIIQHEDERIKNRIDTHFANNVWKPRPHPPENWSNELPDFMKERQKYSFMQSEEAKETFCSIF